MKRKFLSLVMAFFIFISSGMVYFDADATITIGSLSIDSITFRKVHNGYEITGSFIEIWGSGLTGSSVLFETGDGFSGSMGEREIDTDGLLRYIFTKEETISFVGRIAVEGKQIDLELGSMPNFSDADEKVYLVNDTITLTGSNLQLIGTSSGTSTYTASYGNLEREEFTHSQVPPDTNASIQIVNPIIPGGILGEQTVSVEHLQTGIVNPNGTFDKRVVYVYYNAFKIVETMTINDLQLFPNTGGKGDEFFITATNLSANRDYGIYFVSDFGSELTSDNKAGFVSMSIDYEGNKDKLVFTVPNGADFDELQYKLILTDTQNDTIIAMYNLVGKEYSVVDATFLPTIEEVYPTEGPQDGADVQIDGRNLISLNIPDLDTNGVITNTSQDADGLHIVYANGNYDGIPVSITKDIVTKIGGKATYIEYDPNVDPNFRIKLNQGTVDSMFVHAPQADDAETDPFKDVNIEITITLDDGGGNPLVFHQVIIKKDGFKYIPSSLTPEITSVVPDSIHVLGSTNSFYTGDDVMLVIDGSNFLVNRYTDGTGQVFVNYPSILIKTLNNQSLDSYDIHLNPNVEIAGIHGIVYDMSDTIASGNNYYKNGDGSPFKLELKVVDDTGRTITGTKNDDIGTRIIARIPKGVKLNYADYKNILIVNPTRGSQSPGKKKVLLEGIEIVDTNDIPVIESVTPIVVTIEGNEEIEIIGNNFQEGAKLFLDGNEIEGFSREISQSGDKIIIKFTAPEGPAGKTQIVIQNPSGAIATQDFYYVVSFNKDPKITEFLPEKGTAETYVIIKGENFIKEDPTVETLEGLDTLRIIGSRVLLDGKDVNEYNQDAENNIIPLDYVAPDVEKFVTADIPGQKLLLTPYSDNLYIKDNNGKYYSLLNDGDGNPVITDGLGINYTFKFETDKINIYNQSDVLIYGLDVLANFTETQDPGGKFGTFKLNSIEGVDITVYMNNNILFIGETDGGIEIPRISNYVESTVLISDSIPPEYFRLYEDFDGTLVLTNGKDKTYEINYDGTDFKAKKSITETYTINAITNTGFTVNDISPYILKMATVYKKDANGMIVGKNTKVLNRTQIAITVPVLNSGKGYKDLKVLNPDTKYDEKVDEEGFYYIEQASSNPKITSIKPPEGSVDGGYIVTINGKGFEDNMSVYVDGVLVPPTDTNVSSDGLKVVIRMPEISKDLANDYNVSHLDVSVVIMNNDGGNDSKPKGFRYVIPTSSPSIDQVLPVKGSTNGGDIVEIIGYEFRYFEPYENKVGGQGYDLGDPFEDLYVDGLWNNLLPTAPVGAVTSNVFVPPHPYYTEYFTSPILPRVYFGEKEAKIVEYDLGYIKVITPENVPGDAEVYVVNNDSGVSNKVIYTFEASSPKITNINPPYGKRQGLEFRDFYGTDLFQGIYNGYKDNVDNAIGTLVGLEASIRFSDITNRDIERSLPNSGLINAQRATVNLTGDLMVSYNGSSNTITMSVTEDGKIYNRVFSNYTDGTIYLPMEMLTTTSGEFYHPEGTKSSVHDGTTYENLVFEYIKVEVFDKRFLVDRSYAPFIEYKNTGHLVVTTPSYYSVEEVNVLLTNNDLGEAKTKFTYTYPASEPKIYDISPKELSPDGTKWQTKRTVKGGTQIEVRGLDFRDDVKAYIGSHEANIAEKTTSLLIVDGTAVTFDLLILDVPVGNLNEVGLDLPILITNTDFGVANSSNIPDIYGTDKKPKFFVYQKPLSNPVITKVVPEETSQYGGKTIVLVGKDFRDGATVTIGSKGGVPIQNTVVTMQGTILTFVTPLNTLVPGIKKIQVENSDYGTSDFDQSINIISYPTLEPDITLENGTIVDWVTVEGGTKIVIKGDNFYEGVKVIISGERVLSATDQSEGEKGLFKDDQYYTIKDGVLATKVEFISKNELLVTTPEILEEGNYIVTVLNADGGISDSTNKLLYSVPVPSKPVNLKLELIDNRYVRISDYISSGHNYYEIYYFVGSKTTQLIKNNEYLDMKYLGSTDMEPYRIPSIHAIETMRPNQLLIIGLKAVNKYGSSDWSNLEFLTFKDLEDVEELGDPDIDGDIGVPDGVDFISEVVGTDLITTLSEKHLDSYVYIDLKEPKYDVSTRVVNIPGNMIVSNTSIVRVDYRDVNIQFIPINLNTPEFRVMYNNQNAYGRIEVSEIEDAYSGNMLNKIPRGYKVVSKVITIGFGTKNNDGEKVITGLNGAMDLVLGYDPLILSGYIETGIKMYRFDVDSNVWTELNYNRDIKNNVLSTRTSKPGAYVLLLKRN